MPVLERIAPATRPKKAEGTRARARRDAFDPQQNDPQPSRLGNQAKLRQLARQRDKPAQDPDNPDAKADQFKQQFEADPADQSGHARAELNALPEAERGEVIGRVEGKVSSTEFGRIKTVLDEPGPRSPGEPPKEASAPGKAEEARGPAQPPEEGVGPEGAPPETGDDADQPVEEAQAEQDPAPEAPAEDAKATGERDGKETKGADRKKGPFARAGAAAGKAKPVAKGKAGQAAKEQAAADQQQGKAEAAKSSQANGAAAGDQPPPATEAPRAASALEALPAEAKGPDSPSATPAGAPARQAAAQSGPAVVIAGGGGGGGGGGGEAEAALEEGGGGGSPEQEAAEEQADEKMGAKESAGDRGEDEAVSDDDKDGGVPENEAKEDDKVEPGKKPSDEELAKAREAEEEHQREQNQAQDSAAGPAEESAEEGGDDAADQTAAGDVASGAGQAGLASLAESVGGGGEGSGGGGGGGGAVSDQPQPEPPQIESMAPTAAMSSIGGLKVGGIAKSVTGLAGAVDKKMSEEHADLAANAPSMERPSGAPETRQGPIEFPDSQGAAEAVEKTEEGEAASETPVEEVPDPGPSPADEVRAPSIQGGGEGGTLTEAEAQNIEASVDAMPTTDAALDQSAGPAPPLELTGDAAPQQTADQRASLDEAIVAQQEQGAQEVAQPMGEDEIYPVVPQETLEATVPPGEGGGGGGGAAPAADEETEAIVAEEKQGDEVRASTQTASADMQAGEEEQASKKEEASTEHEQQVQDLESENAAQQSAERGGAASEVEAQRGKWSRSQEEAVDTAHTDADTAQSDMDTEVTAQKTKGEEQANAEVEKGDAEVSSLKDKAQTEAEQKKAEAKQESSGGILGWIASKATALFEGLKKAVSAVFNFFRKAVKAAVDLAKKAAAAVIDLARDAIVAAIKVAGAALILVGDVVLAAFPEARERFRGYIQEKVQAAEDAVNQFAEDLKAGINKLLDAFASVLNGLLSLLEKAYLAAIDIVAKAVQGAIKAAQAAIALLGLFAAIIKDVASNPGQWISNLGAAVIDGIKNHLWKAFKAAVKNWFMSKLEEVLGIGMTIFNVLMKGGIQLAEVGKMAFEGLKSAIPPALIGLLVEKLVAMIVPAAGALMAIIEGLQAAWGTISRILQAIDRFVSFLKAVKSGNAGAQFADAVASAAVVVIDFVANWLIKRIRGPATKVGGKIKAIAKKILAKIKAVAKKFGAKLKKAFKKVAGKIKAGFKKLKEKLFGKKKSKEKKDSKKKKQSDEQKRHERLQKALGVIRPGVESMIAGNKSSWVLKAKLLYWRLRYRLTKLAMNKEGGQVRVVAAASPDTMVAQAAAAMSPETHKIIRDVADQLMVLPEVQQRIDRMMSDRQAGQGDSPQNPVQMDPSPLVIGADISQNPRVRAKEFTQFGATGGTQTPGGIWRPATSAPNAMVSAPQIADPSYKELTPMLGSGAAPEVSALFTGFHSTGTLPAGMSQQSAQAVTTLTHITGVEIARDPAHAVRYAAALEAMKNGTMSKEDLFILQNPLAPKKEKDKPSAPRTASEINREDKPERGSKFKGDLKGKEKSALPGSKATFIEKEKNVMIAWMVGLMQTKDPLFHDDEGRKRFVRKHMWDYLKGLGKSTSGIS